jgi:hypothetical protein
MRASVACAMALPLLSSLLWVRPSSAAEPGIDECLAAAEGGQRERDRGHYLQARRDFGTCVAATCPAAVTHDCRVWLEEIEVAMPTVLLSVRDEEGRDVLGVRLALDGAASEPSTGRPLPVDPGEHVLVADAPGFLATRQSLVVVAAQKNRLVTVTLGHVRPPNVRPRPDASASPSPWPATLALGGLGAASLGGSFFFGLSARADLSDARNAPCAVTRSCASADRESIEKRLIVADVLLGLSVAAVASAALWFFTHRSPAAPRPAERSLP